MTPQRLINGTILVGAWLGLIGGLAVPVAAAPIYGEKCVLIQPDGAKVTVRIWGDEFNGVTETLDGYTVVRDGRTQYFCYAELSADGSRLVSTGIRIDSPWGSQQIRQKHLRGSRRVAARNASEVRSAFEAAFYAGQRDARITPVGNVVGLTVLIDFPDEAGSIPVGDVEDYCNQLGYSANGNNGSVRDYFSDVSGGLLDYTNDVRGYFTADENKDYYTDANIPWGTRIDELAKDALDQLDAGGFDFSTLDSDNDGFVDAANFFYVGFHGNNWAEGLWPGAFGFNYNADGVTIDRIQFTNMGNTLTLATFCHENGHMLLGWPDLYDYDTDPNDDSAGVGAYCLMCNTGSGTNPVEPCADLKWRAGWMTVTAIDECMLDQPLTAGTNTAYVFYNPGNGAEHYLLENRQASGRDSAIPDSGLAIWHIDRNGNNSFNQATPSEHYQVTLVQADGNWDLENNVNQGDSTDLYAAPSFAACTPDTNPNTDWWDGSESGLHVFNISSNGNTMTFSVCDAADNQPPVAVCQPGPVQVTLDPTTCCATITADQLDDGSFDPDEGGVTLCITQFGAIAVPCLESFQSCQGPGVYTAELTVTDEDGVPVSCTTTVELIDDTPPAFTTAPANITFECDGAGNVAEINAWLASAVAEDALPQRVCQRRLRRAQRRLRGDRLSDRHLDRHRGRRHDSARPHTATVTVEDTTPPFFTVAPADVVFECDGLGNMDDIQPWLDSAHGRRCLRFGHGHQRLRRPVGRLRLHRLGHGHVDGRGRVRADDAARRDGHRGRHDAAGVHRRSG
jgi:M6 family metalloprotease-like protein